MLSIAVDAGDAKLNKYTTVSVFKKLQVESRPTNNYTDYTATYQLYCQSLEDGVMPWRQERDHIENTVWAVSGKVGREGGGRHSM